MKIAPIFDPEQRRETPQAEQVDLHIIFLVGTILWLIAALIFGGFWLFAGTFYNEFIVCVWGIVIGAMGLVWELYNRHVYRLVALMQQ